MKKSGKNVEKARKLVEARSYKLGEAAELLKKTHHTKFNETVEVAINLGVDPKHSDQVVRGTVGLPNGLGKSVRVLVIASGEKVREAQEAGADFVGGDEIGQKIMEGWTDFDAVIATPDMMRSAGKLGKVLGPRGLMPNPKTGTVTFEVAKAIKEVKAGKVEFRVDKAGIVHCPIGKIQFDGAKLAENGHAVINAVIKAKPAAAKGKYVKRITLTSTMGPGITIDLAEAETLAAAAGPGIVEGRVISIAEIQQLANLPSKEELISKIMFLLNAPAQRIAMALNALPRNLAVTVSEAVKANKFGSGGGAPAPSPEAAQ